MIGRNMRHKHYTHDTTERVVTIRIGDQSHCVRKQTRITTERKSSALRIGWTARVQFADEFGTEFGGLYRVIAVQPSDHDGDYCKFVLEKTP